MNITKNDVLKALEEVVAKAGTDHMAACYYTTRKRDNAGNFGTDLDKSLPIVGECIAGRVVEKLEFPLLEEIEGEGSLISYGSVGVTHDAFVSFAEAGKKLIDAGWDREAVFVLAQAQNVQDGAKGKPENWGKALEAAKNA